MKQSIVPIIKIYCFILLLFTGIFLLLFHTPLFSFQHVLFYRGLCLLGCTTLLVSFVAVICGISIWKTYLQTIIAAIILAISLHLSIFVVFPVTLERSLTMFLLESLQEQKGSVCGGLTKSQMEQQLINGYIVERNAVSKRMDEQSIIKMIEKNNECYRATAKTEKFLQFSQFIKVMYSY